MRRMYAEVVNIAGLIALIIQCDVEGNNGFPDCLLIRLIRDYKFNIASLNAGKNNIRFLEI